MRLVSTFRSSLPSAPRSEARGIAVSEDGRFAVVGDSPGNNDGTSLLIDLATGDAKVLSSQPRGEEWIRGISILGGYAFAADSRWRPGRYSGLFEVPSGQFVARIPFDELEQRLSAGILVSVSPDAKRVRLAAGDELGNVGVWTWDGTLHLEWKLPLHEKLVNALLVDAGRGSLISASNDGTIVRTGLSRDMMEHDVWSAAPEEIRRIAFVFGGDGQPAALLAGCNSGRIVRFRYPEPGEPLMLSREHRDAVVGLAVTHDGERLLSSSLDGKLILWSLGSSSLTELDRLDFGPSGDAPTGLALLPDGRSFVVATLEGRNLRFELAPARKR